MHDGANLLSKEGRRPGRGAVSRLVGADARQALEQIQSSPIVSEGKVCLIGLDAIRERLGARWPGRREMVYEHVRHTLRRQIGAHGFFLRISETDFLVAQPSVSPLTGQAYCLNCLRDLLTYFLGEALINDIVVHQVTSIEDGRIAADKLDATELQAEADKAQAAHGGAASSEPGAISQDRWTPFVANDGRRLRASSRLEPVFQLKTYGRIGYRMTRRVLQLPGETPLSVAEQRQLTSSDIERIDFATLARGLNRLHQEGEGEREPSLILPVSFATLSSQRGRATVAEFFRQAQASVQRGLICEVCDIEGVPTGALLAAASLMRPFCRFIVGRLVGPPQGSLSNLLRETSLQGVSIECPPGLNSDDSFGAFARTIVTAAKPAARAVMLYGVAGPRQAAIASLYGATHASFTTTRPDAEADEPAEAQA